MKILLIAVNAKYIHSNLAVYSLRASAEKQGEQAGILEFTINQQEDEILRAICREKPDVGGFSVFLWNGAVYRRLARALHDFLPVLGMWLGCPAVSWDAEKVMEELPFLSGILIGEGEESFRQLCRCFRLRNPGELETVPGLLYRDREGRLIRTGEAPLPDLDSLPFPYENLQKFENRILYYESSRGCPFSCSYCLSSLDRSLRYRSLALVFRELALFLRERVRQVKFVDRTFNADRKRAAAIWKFLRENDNGITNFHFEIEADLLGEEELRELRKMRPGLVQLEIGVQTTNPETLKAVHRRMDFARLCRNVQRIGSGGNIHQHLDLIAGLPGEDLQSFARSFCQVYALHPQQLQLGFLKVLKGTPLAAETEKWKLRHKAAAPYEILGNRWLPYEDILQLKLVEEMVEVYYNSGQFRVTLEAAETRFPDAFSLYQKLGRYYEEEGYLSVSHTRIRRYEILGEFLEKEIPRETERFRECLVCDLYARENVKNRPAWAGEQMLPRDRVRKFYEEEAENPEILKIYTGRDWRQLKSMTHLEEFREEIPGFRKGRKWLLFDYERRSPLDGSAAVLDVTDRMEGNASLGQRDANEHERMEDV